MNYETESFTVYGYMHMDSASIDALFRIAGWGASSVKTICFPVLRIEFETLVLKWRNYTTHFVITRVEISEWKSNPRLNVTRCSTAPKRFYQLTNILVNFINYFIEV